MAEYFDPFTKDWSEVEWVMEDMGSYWAVYQPPFVLAPVTYLRYTKTDAERLLDTLKAKP